MRGRHFGFLGTLCMVWITARVGFLSVLPDITAAPITGGAPKVIVTPASNDLAANHVALGLAGSENCCPQRRPPVLRNRSLAAIPPDIFPQMPTVDRIALSFSPGQPAATAQPITPWPLPRQGAQPSKLNFYAYSFFRSNAQAGGPVSTGQYGGSQSGFVATYGLARFPDGKGHSRLALLARGAIAHEEPGERELAAGLRWQPSPHVPLTVTAERRFRNARSDALAIYLAGGKSQVALPLRFRLDAFAQAGLVSGNDGGPFFDVVTRAERDLATVAKAPVTLGGGVWSGGQEGIFRVDAGPTVGTQIPVGNARLRVNADWRFRIAGDARPASGPALTLSTSF